MEKIEKAYDTVTKYYDNWHLEPDHFGLQVVEKAVNDLLKAIKSRLETEEKYSFKWDGKEKNLVVQALELNEQYDKLQAENERLKAENEKLKQVANDSIIEQEKLIAKVNELQAENERLKARLRPLEDSYFNGLSSIEIAELAKKSIRITAENRKLEDALQEIRDMIAKPYCCKPQDILAKINEVIGAEE